MGVVERVVISAEFSNTGENSFNPYLTFELPKQYFQQPRITPLSVRKGEREREGDEGEIKGDICLVAIVMISLSFLSSSSHAMIPLLIIAPMGTMNAKI